jgi:hypothetical protein
MGYMNHMLHWIKCIVNLIHLGIDLIATEKYHGTSTNITQKYNTSLKYYSGGEKLEAFKELFDEDIIQSLLDSIMEKNSWKSITIYGETYGGPRLFPKQMGNTYGINKPKFIVFDVQVTTDISKQYFLNFHETEEIANLLKLDLVHFCKCPYEIKIDNIDHIIAWFDEQTNLPSTCPYNTSGKQREGIVIRPVIESTIGKKRDRAICKNLNVPFKETKTPNINKLYIKEKSLEFSKYDEFAEMWVTENRGRHVLDNIRASRDDKAISLKDVRLFLDKIIDDIKEESGDDFNWPQDSKEEKDLKRALGKEGSFIFKSLFEEFNYVPIETV